MGILKHLIDPQICLYIYLGFGCSSIISLNANKFYHNIFIDFDLEQLNGYETNLCYFSNLKEKGVCDRNQFNRMFFCLLGLKLLDLWVKLTEDFPIIIQIGRGKNTFLYQRITRSSVKIGCWSCKDTMQLSVSYLITNLVLK